MDIAVPSWVVPGTYAENLRFLDPMESIDTVELLFFLYDGEVRSLLDAEWETIRGFGDRFRFTAHLPDRVTAEHEELVERLSPLVSHFVVHPYPEEQAEDFAILLDGWMDRYGHGAEAPPRFLVENTRGARFDAALALLDRAGICFDTGHWILEGGLPEDFIKRYDAGGRIAELHLHAVDRAASLADGRLADHRPLRDEEAWLGGIEPFMGSFAGVVDLEVFSWDEAARSLKVLEKRGLVPQRINRS